MVHMLETLSLWEFGFAACVGLLFLSCFGMVCSGLEWALATWHP